MALIEYDTVTGVLLKVTEENENLKRVNAILKKELMSAKKDIELEQSRNKSFMEDVRKKNEMIVEVEGRLMAMKL